MSTESAEDRLIARYFGPLAQHPGALGLVDDAAILVPPTGCDLVLKADAIVGSVHFFADDPPSAVARKALRVNLSDLAAKGAKPLGFLLSLALPDGIGDDWPFGYEALEPYYDLNDRAMERRARGDGPETDQHVDALVSLWLRSIYGL